MRIRRVARERALQFLFQLEVNRPDDLDDTLDRFWEDQRYAAAVKALKGPNYGAEIQLAPITADQAAVRAFADELIRGVLKNLERIDGEIESRLKNWRIDRVARVDRTTLRLSVFEILFREDIPPVVSINEAVELVKKYSTSESGAFVNGILDSVRKATPRPPRSPVSPEA